eukprot:Pgem_evm1s2841
MLVVEMTSKINNHDKTLLFAVCENSHNNMILCNGFRQCFNNNNNNDNDEDFEYFENSKFPFKFKFGENLSINEKRQLTEDLNEHNDVFCQHADDSGCIKLYKEKIILEDYSPIFIKQYKLSHQQEVEFKNIVSTMLKKGQVKYSDSLWNTPVLILPKRTPGAFRLVNDVRLLNKRAIKKYWSMTNINTSLEKMADCNYFLSLDLKDGYCHIFCKILQTEFADQPNIIVYLDDLSAERLAAFDDIKKSLISHALAHPKYGDPKQYFTIYSDSSLHGLGSTLTQWQYNDQNQLEERIIMHSSRALKEHERKWSISELEALGVVWSVTNEYHRYVHGSSYFK